MSPWPKNAQCFVCGSTDFDRVLLGDALFDASDFSEPNQVRKTYPYELTSCLQCDHSSIQTTNPSWLTTRKHPFITYNEPTEYFPFIAELVRSLNLHSNQTSLHCFSYKDFPTANYLSKELHIKNVFLNDYAGCSDDWLPKIYEDGSSTPPTAIEKFISEVRTSPKMHQVVIIGRFLDHVGNLDLLDKVLSLCSPTAHLIFELNDYDRLFAMDTLEFVWNERRNLFQRQHLQKILKERTSMSQMIRFESVHTPPTLFCLISDRASQLFDSFLKIEGKPIVPTLAQRFDILKELWENKLSTARKLGVIGASHKGISLPQFFFDQSTQYSLHDDKEVLKGRNPPVTPPLGFHTVTDFDFSEYSHVVVTTTRVIASKILPKLRDSGFRGEALDFDCRPFE